MNVNEPFEACSRDFRELNDGDLFALSSATELGAAGFLCQLQRDGNQKATANVLCNRWGKPHPNDLTIPVDPEYGNFRSAEGLNFYPVFTAPLPGNIVVSTADQNSTQNALSFINKVLQTMQRVTSQLVPIGHRLNFLPRNFGSPLMIEGESTVYGWMRRFCSAYRGGFWHFYQLSNDGFYMAPDMDERLPFEVNTNGFSGKMSADAAGITVSLFTFSHLSIRYEVENMADAYENLREFAYDHPERALIFRAID